MTKWKVSGPLVPAGLLIGMGIGWAMGHIVAGVLIGLGAGFMALALVATWASPELRRTPRPGARV